MAVRLCGVALAAAVLLLLLGAAMHDQPCHLAGSLLGTTTAAAADDGRVGRADRE